MQWSIEALSALGSASQPAAIASAQPASPPDMFGRLMQSEWRDLNGAVGAAETAMRQVAAGQPLQLHEVMISLERARLSVQTFVQVRNRLVESYQDLMRMQL